MSVAIGTLLAIIVAATWLAALSLLRLPQALDRLHAVSFLNAVTAFLLSAVAFAADGVSGRSVKILLMMVLLLGFGAVLSHTAGRALLLREGRSA